MNDGARRHDPEPPLGGSQPTSSEIVSSRRVVSSVVERASRLKIVQLLVEVRMVGQLQVIPAGRWSGEADAGGTHRHAGFAG